MDDATLEDGIGVISTKGMGAVFVVSSSDEVVGIMTDGDLRRIIESAARESIGNLCEQPLSNVMGCVPTTIDVKALAAEALRLMEDNGITILPVCESGKLVGVVHLHDLIRAGLA